MRRAEHEHHNDRRERERRGDGAGGRDLGFLAEWEVMATLLWAGPAGTHVVRGVLDKARTLPPHGDRDGRDRAQSLSDAEARSGDSMPGESGIVTASGRPLDPRGVPPEGGSSAPSSGWYSCSWWRPDITRSIS